MMSLIFKRLLVGIFKHSSAKQGFDYNANIPSVLQYTMQSAAAMIVNAKADYVMKNMKRLFKDNGIEGVEMRWWQGAEVFQEGYGVEDGIARCRIWVE